MADRFPGGVPQRVNQLPVVVLETRVRKFALGFFGRYGWAPGVLPGFPPGRSPWSMTRTASSWQWRDSPADSKTLCDIGKSGSGPFRYALNLESDGPQEASDGRLTSREILGGQRTLFGVIEPVRGALDSLGGIFLAMNR